MSAFPRRHYCTIADAVADAYAKAHRDVNARAAIVGTLRLQTEHNGVDTLFETLMSELTETFRQDNPRFNTSRFEDAVSTRYQSQKP